MRSTNTITLIRHQHNEPELQDNAVQHLTSKGLNILNRYPFDAHARRCCHG